MRFKALAAMAAISLIAASGSAAAAPVATPPSAVDRAGPDMEQGNELRGTTMWVLAAAGLALLIWGIIELTDDDEEEPVSP